MSEERETRLNQKIRSLHVTREGSVESGLIPLIDRFEVGDTGVDEENIEPFEGLPQRLGNFALGACVTRIGRDDEHVAAKFFARRVESRRIAAGYGDAGAFVQELAGGFEAD